MRTVLFVSLLSVLMACSRTGDFPTEASTESPAPRLPPDGSYARPFVGRGIVTEIRRDIIQIDHETIPGFMAAVTMDFPLENPAMAVGLEPGDAVQFSIEVLDPWSHRIISIEAVEAE